MLANKFTRIAAATALTLTGVFAAAEGAEARDRHVEQLLNGFLDGLTGGRGNVYGGNGRVDRNGNGAGCNQWWYRSNGNPGGTYNVCRGERPPVDRGYEGRRPYNPNTAGESCVYTQPNGRQIVAPCY